MPLFHPKTAIFGGFEGIFSYKTDKSAILCPAKTEVADFVSFKGSIVQGINLQKNVVFYDVTIIPHFDILFNINSMNDLTLERYKIRHFCLCGSEDGGFIGFIRKNALKTTEMSG